MAISHPGYVKLLPVLVFYIFKSFAFNLSSILLFFSALQFLTTVALPQRRWSQLTLQIHRLLWCIRKERVSTHWMLLARSGVPVLGLWRCIEVDKLGQWRSFGRCSLVVWMRAVLMPCSPMFGTMSYTTGAASSTIRIMAVGTGGGRRGSPCVSGMSISLGILICPTYVTIKV